MDNDIPAVMRLEQPDAARILMHPKAQACLSTLMQAEHTAASAARALGLPVNTVTYWVKRLHEQGLLEVVCETPRRRYRAAARAFFAPFERLPADSLKGLYAEIQRPFVEALNSSFAALMLERGGDWGVCLSVPDGQTTLTIVDDTRNITLNSRRPDAPATVNLAGVLHLDFQTAKAMQLELLELYARYAQHGGSQAYAIRLASVPLEGR